MLVGILGLIVGGAALVIALSKKAGAAPPEIYIPTTNDIYSADDYYELHSYYELINELWVSHYIDTTTYNQLYEAYETRFNQLEGSS